MPATLVRLSKSRFTSGLQCHRQLWWRVHEREAAELGVDRTQQAIFDQGARVGEAAREHVPGGVLIDGPHDRYDEKIAATQAAIAAGAKVVYEASFQADGVFVAVDILEKIRGGWRVIEVKSTLSVKEQHLPDLAVQVHVLREAGLDVRKAEVMFLNRECRFPDLSNLFVREDHIEDVEALIPGIRREIRAQRRMLSGALPVVDTGDHCRAPYECPFLDRCHEALPQHHVSTLYRLTDVSAAAMRTRGVETIGEIPDEFVLTDTQARQRRAVQSGETVIETGVGRALAAFERPIAFLDFETVAPAIPVWDGCGPYRGVPVQFSCHVLAADGSTRHFQWIAEGPGDPRPALADALLEATAGIPRIAAYSASFEKGCILGMADFLPAREAALTALAARLVDLLPVVRGHVYHPDFAGGFGLKAVLPAMVPGLDYSDLAIADGRLASAELARLMFDADTMTALERATLRESLLRYCERDTWGLVKLLETLTSAVPRRKKPAKRLAH